MIIMHVMEYSASLAGMPLGYIKDEKLKQIVSFRNGANPSHQLYMVSILVISQT